MGRNGRYKFSSALTALKNPVGVTIDYDSSRLYWVEYGINQIRSSNLQGKDIRTTVTTSDTFPWESQLCGTGCTGVHTELKNYWKASPNTARTSAPCMTGSTILGSSFSLPAICQETGRTIANTIIAHASAF